MHAIPVVTYIAITILNFLTFASMLGKLQSLF